MQTINRWFAALGFLFALQIIASIIRYYVRIFIVKRFGIDDIASLVTLSISITYCALLTAIFSTSHGKAAWQLPLNLTLRDSNYALANVLLYGLGTMCLKVTFGLFLLRILVERWHRMVIYTVMGISVTYGLFFFFFNLFECGNPRNFAINIILGRCYSTRTVNGIAYTHAALCAAADIIYAILPMFYLWKANLDRRTKISVGGILILGCAGCVCTLIRIWWVHYLTGPKIDFFKTGAGISTMSGAELSIGLTCLAFTTYKPLLKRGFFSHTHRTRSNSHSRTRSRRRTGSTPSKIAASESSNGGVVHYTVDVDVYLEGEGDLEAARKRVEMSECQDFSPSQSRSHVEVSTTSTFLALTLGKEDGVVLRSSEEKLVQDPDMIRPAPVGAKR